MKKPLLILSFILGSLSLNFAVTPKNNNWWVFGQNAAIDFNNSTATAVSGKPIVTYDNTASICTDNGRLLFYTDGVTIWDSTDAVMLNGDSLMGNVTAGQEALIVPVPDNSLYYVFTVKEFGSGGLYYSVVDRTLNNGLGAVTTTKNVLLSSPTTEKLIGYYDETHARFWVITHDYGNNNFKCYKVDSHGLDSIPVISSVGSANSGGTYGYDNGAMGQMVISQDGRHIANALEYSDAIELLDFDTQTGIISNPVTINNQNSAWGVAFSPDGSKLYSTNWLYQAVSQWDLSVYTQTAIQASHTNIGNAVGTGSYHAGYLQLAPDGKIYVARYGSPYLATISSPDSLGLSCGFTANGFNLGSGTSRAGLSSILVFPGAFTGINDIHIEEMTSMVYPNPANFEFSIVVENELSLKTTIQFINTIGQSVVIPSYIEGNKCKVQCEGIAKGSYFYILTDRSKIARGKIIID